MQIRELMDQTFVSGEVTYISVRPKRKEAVINLKQVLAVEGKGLEGDRYSSKGGSRQVTLIQFEHLQAIGSFLGKPIDPASTRRNIVVKGINLIGLKGKRFKIGEAVLEYSGECHPCTRMEENLGPGGYNAMRGHGGITAKVIVSGLIKKGDTVTPQV